MSSYKLKRRIKRHDEGGGRLQLLLKASGCVTDMSRMVDLVIKGEAEEKDLLHARKMLMVAWNDYLQAVLSTKAVDGDSGTTKPHA